MTESVNVSENVLTCVVSGSHVNQISWFFNSKHIMGNLDYTSTLSTQDGWFSYRQVTANQSQLVIETSRLRVGSCGDMTRLDGEYRCQAEGQAAGIRSSHHSSATFRHTCKYTIWMTHTPPLYTCTADISIC